jgi:hypothetical protein
MYSSSIHSLPYAARIFVPLVQAHAAGHLAERARQRRHQQAGGVRAGLGVVGVGDAADAARELDHRVLEAAAGAQERHPALAGAAHGGQRALRAAVRRRGHQPHRVHVPQRLLFVFGHALGGHPHGVHGAAEGERGEAERLGHGAVRHHVGVVVADQRDERGLHGGPGRLELRERFGRGSMENDAYRCVAKESWLRGPICYARRITSETVA